MDTLLVEQRVRLAASGGGMRLNAGKILVDQLVRIAAAAGASGARLVVEGADKLLLDQMVRIAAAGKGGVFFEP